MLLLFAILNIFRSNLLLPSLPTPALLHFLTINTPLFSYFQYIHFFLKAQCFLHCLFCRHWDLIKIISVFQVPDVLFYMRSAKQKNPEKACKCEGLVRMFLRFRFCGIVCCVLYRFPFPQSDL